MTAASFTVGLSKGPANNINTNNVAFSWPELVALLTTHETGPKDGPYITRGPCTPTRCDANLEAATLAIFDGDHGIDPQTGEQIDAPAAARVHEVMSAGGMAHIVSTTHSHGTKGTRWRLFVPVSRPYTKDESEAVTRNLHETLTQAGLYTVYSGESQRWSQAWFLPRIASANAPREAYAAQGDPLSVLFAVSWWPVYQRGRIKVRTLTPMARSGRINDFNASHDLMTLLQSAGYILKGSTTINGAPAYKLLHPGSTTGVPGTFVFRHRTANKDVVFSHSGNDPLCVGRSLDAYDVAGILGGAR